ncbi:MAG: hypothetical protein R3263_01265 [Myxococcota bacterium]|nr:hypothetical protein [Myxococcota bacterium]
MARASEPRRVGPGTPGAGPRLGRRALLAAGAGWAAALALGPLRVRPARSADALPDETRRLLETSGFVYVSPLLAHGRESTCHGEVWFGWLDGDVVLITARDAWKARALARGLDRARIWVGDHGRWKQLLGRNEAFRQAPHFEARVSRSKDAALLDRLMRTYRDKYPDEIGRWEPRMREGFARGERWLLRYTPRPEAG